MHKMVCTLERKGKVLEGANNFERFVICALKTFDCVKESSEVIVVTLYSVFASILKSSESIAA